MHLEAASTCPVAALAALQVLQVGMLLSCSPYVDDMVVDLGRFSCASPASLHGSNPLSLMFSSFRLPREGFARLAQAQLQHPEHA